MQAWPLAITLVVTKAVCRKKLSSLPYYDGFSVSASSDGFPRRANSCDEVRPVYLTNAIRPYSFGHTVRDFFFTFTANVVQLGVANTIFMTAIIDIMPYLGFRNSDVSRGMRVLRKYAEYIGAGALWFKEVTDSCLESRRYVVFRSVVAGSLLFDMRKELFDHIIFPNRWGGCDTQYLQMHRDMAYRLARLTDVPPAYKHSQIKVLFGDKPQDDSRRINNVAELIPALQQRFPTYKFVNKVLTHLTAREQLEEMSSTTIFISPHASSSFRMVYLPNAAHAIIIGPPELDGHDAEQSFSEIDVCWEHVPYYSMGRYHVTERSEYVVRYERGYQPNRPKIVKYYHWFDSDCHATPEKMGDLIEEGVRLIEAKKP